MVSPSDSCTTRKFMVLEISFVKNPDNSWSKKNKKNISKRKKQKWTTIGFHSLLLLFLSLRLRSFWCTTWLSGTDCQLVYCICRVHHCCFPQALRADPLREGCLRLHIDGMHPKKCLLRKYVDIFMLFYKIKKKNKILVLRNGTKERTGWRSHGNGDPDCDWCCDVYCGIDVGVLLFIWTPVITTFTTNTRTEKTTAAMPMFIKICSYIIITNFKKKKKTHVDSSPTTTHSQTSDICKIEIIWKVDSSPTKFNSTMKVVCFFLFQTQKKKEKSNKSHVDNIFFLQIYSYRNSKI